MVCATWMRPAVTDHMSHTAKPRSRLGIEAHILRVMMVLPSFWKNFSSSMSQVSRVMPPDSEVRRGPVDFGFLTT